MMMFRNLGQCPNRDCFRCPNCIKNASRAHYFEVGTIQLWVLWMVLFQRGVGGSNGRGGAGQFGGKLKGDSITGAAPTIQLGIVKGEKCQKWRFYH